MTTENEQLFGLTDIEAYIKEIECNPFFRVAASHGGIGTARAIAICSILSDVQDFVVEHVDGEEASDTVQQQLNRAKYLMMHWYLPDKGEKP